MELKAFHRRVSSYKHVFLLACIMWKHQAKSCAKWMLHNVIYIFSLFIQSGMKPIQSPGIRKIRWFVLATQSCLFAPHSSSVRHPSNYDRRVQRFDQCPPTHAHKSALTAFKYQHWSPWKQKRAPLRLASMCASSPLSHDYTHTHTHDSHTTTVLLSKCACT